MKGYDTFYENPGPVEERLCQVCGTLCLVERNQLGATGFIAAMGGKKTYHDYFHCPHAHKEWHDQALQLVREIEKTPSKRLAELMRLDLIDLLEEHGIQHAVDNSQE